MNVAIIGFQFLSAALVVFGGALAMSQQYRQRGTSRFDHSVANDFEIGFRSTRGDE